MSQPRILLSFLFISTVCLCAKDHFSSPINHASKLATFPLALKRFPLEIALRFCYFIISTSRSQSFGERTRTPTFHTFCSTICSVVCNNITFHFECTKKCIIFCGGGGGCALCIFCAIVLAQCPIVESFAMGPKLKWGGFIAIKSLSLVLRTAL